MPSASATSDGHGTTLSVASSLSIVAHDIGTVNRLVGFYEYRRALHHLDTFLATASPAEIAAADEIVTEHNELTVFVNLSRFVRPGGTGVIEDPAEGVDDFSRRGLAWLTAVARVEVQAMIAAFTSHQSPFSVFPPSDFDQQEYNEVLLDGMKTHFWAFTRDPILPAELVTKLPSARTLAYLRRLVMVRAFSRAVKANMGPQFDLSQAIEMQGWEQELGALQEKLVRKVQSVFAMSQLQTAMGKAAAQQLMQQCRGLCAGLQ